MINDFSTGFIASHFRNKTIISFVAQKKSILKLFYTARFLFIHFSPIFHLYCLGQILLFLFPGFHCISLFQISRTVEFSVLSIKSGFFKSLYGNLPILFFEGNSTNYGKNKHVFNLTLWHYLIIVFSINRLYRLVILEGMRSVLSTLNKIFLRHVRLHTKTSSAHDKMKLNSIIFLSLWRI